MARTPWPTPVPTVEALGEKTQSPAFAQWLEAIWLRWGVRPQIDFSRCSLAYGWNLKCRKGGKSLCTIYPGEGRWQAMVVIGQKEWERAEMLLPAMDPAMQRLWRETDGGMGQKWLMIDLTDGSLMPDALRLMALRLAPKA